MLPALALVAVTVPPLSDALPGGSAAAAALPLLGVPLGFSTRHRPPVAVGTPRPPPLGRSGFGVLVCGLVHGSGAGERSPRRGGREPVRAGEGGGVCGSMAAFTHRRWPCGGRVCRRSFGAGGYFFEFSIFRLMELFLHREVFKGQPFTMGRLSVGGSVFCDTLEPQSRGLCAPITAGEVRRIKVAGRTAIPLGTYRVVLGFSSRFSGRRFYKSLGGLLPRVEGVPGFSGVLIHCGNVVSDTAGCVLVGVRKGAGVLGDSQKTFSRLLKEFLLPAHRCGQGITLHVL